MASLLPILLGAMLVNVFALESVPKLRLFASESDRLRTLLLGCVSLALLLGTTVLIAYPLERLLLPAWEIPYLEPLIAMFLITVMLEIASMVAPEKLGELSLTLTRMSF